MQIHSVGSSSHPGRHVAPVAPIINQHRTNLISWNNSAFPRRCLPLHRPTLLYQQAQHGRPSDSTHRTYGAYSARSVRPQATAAGREEESDAAGTGRGALGLGTQGLEIETAALFTVAGRLGGAEGRQQGRQEGRQEGRQDRGMEVKMFTEDIPTQMEAVTAGVTTLVTEAQRSPPDIDYLQELLAIQQQGPRNIGFFGTRNMGFMHQQLIEILSYAMIITNNHIYTSGAAGTNAAVIRGALRAEKAELLTVILPQSLGKQPPESQELLKKVENLVEKPHNDHLPLLEASRLCNMDILSEVEHVICFAFHDSRLLMETCQEAKDMGKIVTLFYLD
ncbi:hypothetical protein CLOM_g19392 [Closterium sp. NIES-68]|nr:hypothetical protein CLOM_g19392 [Closterium sp. NIES-68]GJP76891.1 hypothetical protein CLOP_g7339 [Closterium sp. NIES-67]